MRICSSSCLSSGAQALDIRGEEMYGDAVVGGSASDGAMPSYGFSAMASSLEGHCAGLSASASGALFFVSFTQPTLLFARLH